jgi:O-antigen/teichoic acid export membrane protein
MRIVSLSAVLPRFRLRAREDALISTETLFVILANGATAGFGFVFWTLAGRLYPAREVGLVAALVSVGGLLAMLSVVGLDYGVVRYLPQADDAARLINSCLWVTGVAAVGISGIYLGRVELWSSSLRDLRRVPWLGPELAVVVLLTALSGVLSGVFLARKRASFILAHAVVFGAVRAAGAALFGSLVLHAHARALLGAWGAGLAAAVAVDMLVFLPRAEGGRYRFRLALAGSDLLDMASFAFANYLTTLLWSAPGLLLPLLVVHLAGLQANAYFYVAWNATALLAMIPTAASLVVFAHGSADAAHLPRRILEGGRLALVLLVPAVAAVLVGGDRLLWVFGPAYAHQGTRLLSLLALSALPLTVNVLFFSIRRVQQRMAGVVACAAWILAATLGLSVVLLPGMGLVGVGIAWLLAQTSSAAVLGGRFLLRRWSGMGTA